MGRILKATESRRIVNENSKHSLIQHLMMSALLDPNWFDIEKEIDRFVVKHSDCTDEEAKNIRNEYNLLIHALTNYLKRIFNVSSSSEVMPIISTMSSAEKPWRRCRRTGVHQ
jgi:hypothetical protein